MINRERDLILFTAENSQQTSLLAEGGRRKLRKSAGFKCQWWTIGFALEYEESVASSFAALEAAPANDFKAHYNSVAEKKRWTLSKIV